MPEIVLQGCRSRPLAGYLKALGVLALISNQKDKHATGHWQDSCFVLESHLDASALQNFFLHEYSPTPLVTPWNGGSGFYITDNQKALQSILDSEHEKLQSYGTIIKQVCAWRPLHELNIRLEKAPKNKRSTACNDWRKEYKEHLLLWCRAHLPEICLPWLDTAYILKSSNDVAFSPLLGTGGNEGRLEFGNNYMQVITSIFHAPAKAAEALRQSLYAALFGAASQGMQNIPLGQFDPGSAGGFNQGMGFEHKNVPSNPWDYILMLEGTLLFAGAVSRRNMADAVQATAPFTVRKTAAGYASSALEGKERGEMWLPLWEHKVSLQEVRHVLGEGRVNLGRKQARTGMDFARAVSSLGVDRGITSFERYSFLERRGQSYVALPSGNISVRYEPSLAVLDDVDTMLQSLRKATHTPEGIQRGIRNLEQATFRCIQKPDAERFQNLCRIMARLDAVPTLEKYILRPLGTIKPQWIQLCDDNSPEVRLAAALASIGDKEQGSIRANMTAVHPKEYWKWAKTNVVCPQGSTIYEHLGHILLRRLMEGDKGVGLASALQGTCTLHPADALLLCYGNIDAVKLQELFRAFSLIPYTKISVLKAWKEPIMPLPLPHAWSLFKMLHSPRAHLVLPQDIDLRHEARVPRLIAAGRLNEAYTLTERRLRVSGIPILSTRSSQDTTEALQGLQHTRLLASLLVPIHNPHKIVTQICHREAVSC